MRSEFFNLKTNLIISFSHSLEWYFKMRRQANGSDVRLEINDDDQEEQNDILGSQSDIDDSEMDLLDEEDTEEFLSQPLVQSKTFWLKKYT